MNMQSEMSPIPPTQILWRQRPLLPKKKKERGNLLEPQQALQGPGKEKGILILAIHQVGMGVTPLHLETLPLWMKGVGKSQVLSGTSFNSSFEGEGVIP
jgi:hypothetical protein